MSERSNVEATVRAACEHLNSLISNPKEQVVFLSDELVTTKLTSASMTTRQ